MHIHIKHIVNTIQILRSIILILCRAAEKQKIYVYINIKKHNFKKRLKCQKKPKVEFE